MWTHKRGIDHTDSYLDGAALRASFGGALPSKTVNISHERSASFSHLDSKFISVECARNKVDRVGKDHRIRRRLT